MHNGLDPSLNNVNSDSDVDATTIKSRFFAGRKSSDHDKSQSTPNLDDFPSEDHENGPPVKRRKLADSASHKSSPRATSPPWKKVTVDGPTSFVEGGRRKSGRTNAIPLELQPASSKRQTRAAVQQSPAVKSKYANVSARKATHKPTPSTPSSKTTQVNGNHRGPGRPRTSSVAGKSPAKLQELKSLSYISSDSPPKRQYKRRGLVKEQSPVPPPRNPTVNGRGHRGSKHSEAKVEENNVEVDVYEQMKNWPSSDEGSEQEDEETCEGPDEDEEEEESTEEEVPLDPNFKLQRLNFKVHVPAVTVQHPLHVVPPKKHPTFREWLEHDDPLEGTDATHLTEREVKREARVRTRIIEAAEPGGVLSLEKCSVYIPEPQDEPAQQYAHQDHLIAHAVYFRKLLNKEHRDHVNLARKTANLALDKWKHNDPWSIAEANRKYWETAYRPMYIQCVKDLARKWDMLRAEVRQYQLKRWEEEQDELGKEALGKMLEKSSRLLDKRRRGSSIGASTSVGDDDGSEADDDASGSEEEGSGSESEDEKNMSTSQSGSEEDTRENLPNEDDGLTVDEIRRKYAEQPTENLDRPPDLDVAKLDATSVEVPNPGNFVMLDSPDTPPRSGEGEAITSAKDFPEEMDDNMLDESDESVAMNTDVDDSDEDSEDDDDDDSDGSEDDVQTNGLLGFFSKEELEPAVDHVAAVNGIESDDEVGAIPVIIPDATQVQTPSASNSEAPSIDVAKQKQLEEASRQEVSNLGIIYDPMESSRVKKTSSLTKLGTSDQALDLEPDSLPATPVSSKPMRTAVPSLLRGTLREYQHYGLEWLAGLYANGTNGILADEMGLGKTIQTISLLAHLAVEHEVWGPHLIVVPTSVMLNWEMEFKKFLPGFKILTYYGTQEERKQKRKGWLDNDKWNVCITSYQLVLQDQQTFKRRAWHYLVLDEAHNIKNFRSQRWQTLLTFRTRARLLLTGTPLQNNLTELWSLLFFLMPSDSTETGIAGFAGLQDFTSWFKKPVDQILEQGRETMDDEARELVHRLHGVLRPFLLRRLKADVEKQMPGKYEHVVYCKLSKRQRHLYDGYMSRAGTRETLAHGNYLSIINCLMQLRKVCNHPDLFDTRQISTSFAMPRSAVADFEIKDLLVRRRLLNEDPFQRVSLDVVNLLPGGNGPVSALETIQTCRLGALARLRQLVGQQYARIIPNMEFDGTTIPSTLAYMENRARSAALDVLRHHSYLTSLRSQRRPLFSHGLMERLRIDIKQLPASPMPTRRNQLSEWWTNTSPAMEDMVLSLPRRAEAMEALISKFACITPAVVAPGINELTLTHRGIEIVQEAQQIYPEDSFHEARMRLSIAFPDKRLLQYDCGKLQRLEALLRTLQAGGHRALIFTQMTKVLDILEQFLNIHGYRYLRLDGATKIEQRQILTDRFNNDDRILVFILSSRSGGLGINLTGADTVIFYDLDWNPAMDKQCQDRCHRIGQTRDVHIYRFVSEHTIEANILRKANQKRMLDDVVIQEGDFTTDYFNKPSVKDALDDDDGLGETDAEASAAMDRVLGGGTTGKGGLSAKILEQAEDQEDITAAKVAEKEIALEDDALDFDERTASGGAATPRTPGLRPATPGNGGGNLVKKPGVIAQSDSTDWIDDETLHSGVAVPQTAMATDIFAEKEGIGVDQYIVGFLEREMRGLPVAVPVDKSKVKAKKGEHRVRRVK
jgi:helicase SWR1